MIDPTLEQLRETRVMRHMETEVEKDFEATISTFHHPRYEVVPTSDVHEGEEALRIFYAESAQAFPDFTFENVNLHHAADSVIVELDFVGTHLGSWRGLPPTGRSVRYRMCNVFVFEGYKLICERLHFDLLTVLMQLGIARDPTTPMGRLNTFASHPIHVGLAFIRHLVSK